MSHKQSYQLTKHAVGSKAEIWALSWPLMLGFCSNSLMFFADRLYLAHHSVAAMNAMAYAATFCYLFLIFPFALCEITEVFVGRIHGQGTLKKVGEPTWQIIWLSIASWPLFVLVGTFFASILFVTQSLEACYFSMFLCFGPCILVTLALTGFFVGIGKTRVITFTAVIANILNILLAPLFIFTLDLGIKGAAIATGIAQSCQALILLGLFLRKELRAQYNTQSARFNGALFKEMMRLGLPAGISRSLEVLAHCLFFVIMAKAGPLELTVATFVQSFFLLVVFSNDGLSKGVTAIISNLVGAKMDWLIPKVIQASYKVQVILFGIVTMGCFLGAHTLFCYALKPEEQLLFGNSSFVLSLNVALFMMCLFFLFDGLWWVHVGHLTAIGDTKFIMYANCLMQWFVYVMPTYLLVTYANLGAAGGWTMIAINACLLFTFFRLRSHKKLQREVYQ